ncbi:hypothetical protein H6P81_010515 [Aristolochia fimbriata]|uniref:DUF4216 domain-containing protein n=1 Tax=Aristolochia fimbriata TaxID=158543 RepID=A0AAV7ER33_ARIFI|nr:hypothetical protein H6P81_010515 [Aristolochia fimbriata]
MDGIESKLNRPLRYEGPTVAGTSCYISAEEVYQAHRFVLFNIEKCYALFCKPLNMIVQSINVNINKANTNGEEDIFFLASGPKPNVITYKGFFMNDYNFEITYVDNLCVTQNSGIATIREAEEIFYGTLEMVLEVTFGNLPPIHLFNCNWYDMKEGSGWLVDDHKFTMVNTTKRCFADKPFIFPSQAQQVFYSMDPLKSDWSIINRWKPRDTYDILTIEVGRVEAHDEVLLRKEDVVGMGLDTMIENSDVVWVRKKLGITVQVDERLLNLT